MPAVEALCLLFGINHNKFTKYEKLLLEAELFTRVCDKLQDNFKQLYKDYFHLMHFTKEMENEMIDNNFIRFIIKDILSTEEYNLQGIACYTNVSEEVLQEILISEYTYPSAMMLRKMIELHRSVRKELYDTLAKKISIEYIAA